MPTSPNAEALLEAHLSGERITLLRDAAAIAKNLRLPLYLVGGAVRDLLLGEPIQDIDLVVEGDASVLAAGMAQALGGAVLAHSRFGTAKVELRGHRIDVVTARNESYRQPGALPTVWPSDIQDDLRRRDFTINAMAFRLAPEPFGQMVDPLDGQRDLRSRLVRVLHPASFQDDATRILRAVRYEQRLRFRLEQQTEAYLQRDLSMLDTIGGQRLRRELQLLFQESDPLPALVRLGGLGVTRALYPPLAHGRASLRRGVAELKPLHYLAWLTYPLSSTDAEGIIARLAMPKSWAVVVRDTVSVRRFAAAIAGDLSPSVVYRQLHGLSLEALQVATALESGPAREYIHRYLEQWRNLRPLLTGRHLVRLGVPQGPQVGRLMDTLLEARLEGQVVTRADEEALVRHILSETSPE